MDDRLIRGRYKTQELIGEGGIARVYRALDISSATEVAIKITESSDPAIARAVENEFLFGSLNRHPSLIAPLSYTSEDDQVVIAWPFIAGTDLKKSRSGVISDSKQLEYILASILECAAFIHFCGYYYNDYKPENIFIVDELLDDGRRRARPVLLDYNLVSQADQAVSKRGTINYTAPEILLGKAPSPVSDIYSIGTVIYELLTGELPFDSPDDDTLIKAITESGIVDFSNIPEKFRKGLETMLDLDPESRPPDFRAAARILGLAGQFESLYSQRIDFYLSAGRPPFYMELTESFENYLGNMSWKVFWIKSLNHDNSALDFLGARYALNGYRIWRIPVAAEDGFILKALDSIGSIIDETPRFKAMLLIDDICALGSSALSKLRMMAGPKNSLAVAVGADRWAVSSIPAVVFDPLQNTTKNGATEISLKSNLKTKSIEFGFSDIARRTCGDPQLVHLHLKQAASSSEIDLLAGEFEGELPAGALSQDTLETALRTIFAAISDDQKNMLRKLSVWGDSVPMLILGIFEIEEQNIFDELLKTGHLMPEKDAISFSSGDARDFIYSGLNPNEKKQIHRFWAEAVEKRLSDTDGYLEYSAIHWGESDDIVRGFTANYRAAYDFLTKRELSKAGYYAEKLQKLAEQGGGSMTDAVTVCASIYKEEGDYKAARQKYLEIIKFLRTSENKALEARTYKELGDLYRSIKKTKKAVYYTSEALSLFTKLSDQQGVADCNNNIGLTYWIDEQYDKALGSFQKAFEANTKINNHRELAKIQSNRAIIKDITGKTDEVAEHFLEARNHATEANDPRLLALISNNLGYFYIRQGEYELAVKYLQEAMSSSEKIGYTEGVINALSNLGLSHLRSGDLFIAVDYNQKALETAEALGSRHLAASAELYLAEACILMGNYSLADNVLCSIESGKAYAEDKSLRPQIELLRSKLCIALGLTDKASELAMAVSEEADSVGDKRLRLEALLFLAEANLLRNRKRSIEILTDVAEKTLTLGHGDILTSAGILLAEIYLANNDLFNAESWIERVNLARNLSKEGSIKARILESEIYLTRKKYDNALEILFEIESIAAVSGFVPLALKSSVVLAGIFLDCLKLPRARETLERAASYRSRLYSALPEYVSSATLEATPYMARLIVIAKEIDNKEFLRV